MAQSREDPGVGVAQIAGKVLSAWRDGERSEIERELKNARWWAAQARPSTTLEMEKMEVLSGAVESLGGQFRRQSGAVRLLEHLAKCGRAVEVRTPATLALAANE